MIDSDQALVLRTYKLGETSKIVALFGRRHGRLRLVARGVRGRGSRSGASLEIGNEVEIVFSQRPGSELGTLREASLSHAWLAGARRLENLGAGLAVVELLERLLPEGAAEPRLLDEALSCLAALAATGDRGAALLAFYAFELRLLQHLGLRPDLGGCGRCGRRDAPSYRLDLRAGSLTCAACGGPGPGRLVLPAEVVEVLGELERRAWADVGGVETSVAARRLVGLVLHRLLEAHLERYRYPRALQLLKKVDRQETRVSGGASAPGAASVPKTLS